MFVDIIDDIEIIKLKCHKPIMKTLYEMDFLSLLEKIKIEEIEEGYLKFYLSLFADEWLSNLLFSKKWVIFTIYILINPKLDFLLELTKLEDTENYVPLFMSMFEKKQGDKAFYEKEVAVNTMEWLKESPTLSKAISLVESIFEWPIENYKHFVFLLDELPKLRDEKTGENVFWKNLIFLIENSPHLALGAMEKLSDPRWTLLTIQIILNSCLHRFLEKDFNAHPLTLGEVYEAADYENDPTGARVLWLKIIVALNDLNAFKTWVGFNEEMYQECHSRGMTYTPGRMTGTEAAMIESVYTHDRQGAGLPITSDMLALLYKVMPTDQFLERLQKIYNKDFLVQKTFHFIDLLREAVEKNQRNLTPVFALLTASYIADFYRTHLQALITKQKELVKQDDEAGVVKLEEEEAEVIKLKFFAPLRETAQDGPSSGRLSRV